MNDHSSTYLVGDVKGPAEDCLYIWDKAQGHHPLPDKSNEGISGYKPEISKQGGVNHNDQPSKLPIQVHAVKSDLNAALKG